jgi:hypothetical protein
MLAEGQAMCRQLCDADPSTASSGHCELWKALTIDSISFVSSASRALAPYCAVTPKLLYPAKTVEVLGQI